MLYSLATAATTATDTMFLQKKVWNVPQCILSHKMPFLKEKDEKIKSVIGDVPLKSSASTSSAFLSRHWKIFKMIRTCCDSGIGEDDKNHFGYFFTQSSNRSDLPILYRVWSCPHGHIHMYAQFNLILLYCQCSAHGITQLPNNNMQCTRN